MGSDDLDWAMSRARLLVAADGGAETIVANGYSPDVVIGDMDSVDPAVLEQIEANRLHHVSEQDTTDFEKCLQRIAAPGVVALGCLGKRLDHSLATLAVTARTGTPCLLIGPQDVAFVAPARLVLDLPSDCRVSLFPLAPVTGRSRGLRWPIDGLELSPMGRLGTSNQATGKVFLECEGIIVLLPRDMRDAAFEGLFAEN